MVDIMSESILTPTGKLTFIKTQIRDKTKARMIAYMKYAGFDDEGDFVDKCINFVCDKDKPFLVKEIHLMDELKGVN